MTECFDGSDEINCGECLHEKTGIFYRGFQSHSNTGKMCLYWEDILNHQGIISLETGEKNVKELENYCRNIDGKESPWCYVSLNEWEFCSIPICS